MVIKDQDFIESPKTSLSTDHIELDSGADFYFGITRYKIENHEKLKQAFRDFAERLNQIETQE